MSEEKEIYPAGGLPIVAPGDNDFLLGTQLGRARRMRNPEVLAAARALQEELDNLFQGVGYEPPVDYTGDLSIERRTQTVLNDGVVYAPVPGLVPFTTPPVFDSNHWAPVQDAMLRQDLTTAGPGKGAELVAFQQTGGLRPLQAPPTLPPLAQTIEARLNDIFYPGRAINSTVAVTVYCDPVNGLDSNAGTIAAPLRTIQAAVNRCPHNLFHNYTIDLVSAATLPVTYDEDVLVSGVTIQSKPGDVAISSRLRIVGTGPSRLTSDPRQVKVGSLTVVNVKGVSGVWAYGMEFQRAKPYYEQAACVGVFGSSEVAVQNLAFAPGVGCAGVRFYGSNGVVKLSNFDNCTNAVWAKREALVSVSDCIGDTSLAAHRAEEGAQINVVRNEINTAKNPTFFGVGGGGSIIDQAGNWVRFRGMYYGCPANGVAEGDSASVVGIDTFAAGYNFVATGGAAVCIGLNSETLGGSSVAVGANAKTAATASNTAIGATAQCLGARRATAIGSTASAAFENSTGVGYGAVPSAANQVKLGNNCASVTDLDFEALGVARGVIVKSPNGNRWRIRVTDAGVVEAFAL